MIKNKRTLKLERRRKLNSIKRNRITRHLDLIDKKYDFLNKVQESITGIDSSSERAKIINSLKIEYNRKSL